MARYAYLAAALAVPGLAFPQTLNTRVVGGEPAKEGEFPYAVSIRSYGLHDCGGVLINEDTVLTTSQCTSDDLKEVQIYAGSLSRTTGGILVNVTSAKFAEPFDPDNNSFAIFKLATRIPESDKIKYAKLAPKGTDPAAGEKVTVAGWGLTNEENDFRDLPDKLQRVTLDVIDRAICHEDYQHLQIPINISENMLCAGMPQGGKGACSSDAGAPLVNAAGEVVGMYTMSIGCTSVEFPNGYSRIGSENGSKFLDSLKN